MSKRELVVEVRPLRSAITESNIQEIKDRLATATERLSQLEAKEGLILHPVDEVVHQLMVEAIYKVFVGQGMTEALHRSRVGTELNFFVNQLMIQIADKWEIVKKALPAGELIAVGGGKR